MTTDGELVAGTDVLLVHRPNPAWTIARANHLMYHDKDAAALAAELARVPALSLSWRETLTARGG